MKYKVSCPACGSKLSRWHLFSTLATTYRCRQCNARFRLAALGWWITLAILMVQVFWLMLCQWQLLPPTLAIALLMSTCGLAIWWFPYLSPVQPVRNQT